MPFSELESKLFEKAVSDYVESKRPPKTSRSRIDLKYKFYKYSFELLEIDYEPLFGNEPIEMPFAKATFVNSKNIWKIYWQRADLKWHAYPIQPEAKTVKEVLEIVEEDEACCFYG
jgi:hypothetical protein